MLNKSFEKVSLRRKVSLILAWKSCLLLIGIIVRTHCIRCLWIPGQEAFVNEGTFEAM